MEESYNKFVAVTVSDQGQSPREDIGGNHREIFAVTNRWADLGRVQQDISATFAGKMDAFRRMTMGNVPHLGNSAGSAEAEIISKERLRAKEDSSQGKERETKVEQELAELFKYGVCPVQRGHLWQRSISERWMVRI